MSQARKYLADELEQFEEYSEYYKFTFTSSIIDFDFDDQTRDLLKNRIIIIDQLRLPAPLEILINEFDSEFSVEERDIIHANQVFKKALDLLKSYISRISSENGALYITDPYLFCNQKGISDLEYSELILELLLLSRSKNIVFVTTKPRDFSMTIYENVCSGLEKWGVHYTLFESDDFHDRFWVSENNGAFILGCSINRVAKKTSLITSLNPSDYEEILDILRQVSNN